MIGNQPKEIPRPIIASRLAGKAVHPLQEPLDPKGHLPIQIHIMNKLPPDDLVLGHILKKEYGREQPREPRTLRLALHHPAPRNVPALTVNLALVDEVDALDFVAAVERVLLDGLREQQRVVQVHGQLGVFEEGADLGLAGVLEGQGQDDRGHG
jgi:hypothetical protein